MVAELRRTGRRSSNNGWRSGSGKAGDDALVFATWDGRTRSPNVVTDDGPPPWLRPESRVTFHPLRHTHVSRLIAAGVDI